MSIISDALRKAQKKMSEDDNEQENSQSADMPRADGALSDKIKNPEDRPAKGLLRRANPVPAAGALILLLAAGLLLYGNMAGNRPSAKKPADETKKIVLLTPSTAHGRPVLPDISAITDSGSDFILTGIIHGDGLPMAVINGTVYTVGDTVNSAKILEIGEDTVILDKGRRRINLTVK